jgi:hypothetical protein
MVGLTSALVAFRLPARAAAAAGGWGACAAAHVDSVEQNGSFVRHAIEAFRAEEAGNAVAPVLGTLRAAAGAAAWTPIWKVSLDGVDDLAAIKQVCQWALLPRRRRRRRRRRRGPGCDMMAGVRGPRRVEGWCAAHSAAH